MKNKVLPIILAKDLTKSNLDDLISARDSFIITGVPNFSLLIAQLERSIEEKGMKCRVYTENRSLAIAAAAIPTGITQLAGVASAVGIGIHNLFTFNPDYEIAKNISSSKITVTYKK